MLLKLSGYTVKADLIHLIEGDEDILGIIFRKTCVRCHRL